MSDIGIRRVRERVLIYAPFIAAEQPHLPVGLLQQFAMGYVTFDASTVRALARRVDLTLEPSHG